MRPVCDYPGCTSAPAFVLHWRGPSRRASAVCDPHYRALRTLECCWVEPLDGGQLKRGDECQPKQEKLSC